MAPGRCKHKRTASEQHILAECQLCGIPVYDLGLYAGDHQTVSDHWDAAAAWHWINWVAVQATAAIMQVGGDWSLRELTESTAHESLFAVITISVLGRKQCVKKAAVFQATATRLFMCK